MKKTATTCSASASFASGLRSEKKNG